ncbi:MAG: cob(I)yrinic acid a,c-diamide adenosyltransferase [Candidatus Aenigmarchaeota archaeon]|nr:cob(I)yrinic acid a,c-diamide adenosyltransferase [Candidatus Aenigmarchaeota archaeon]
MKPNIGAGDKGRTSLIGKNIDKTNLRISCIGNADELNAFLGLVRSRLSDDKRMTDINNALEKIQQDIFLIGSNLANIEYHKSIKKITMNHVKFLEDKLQLFEKELETLAKFILPGGTKTASLLHISRAVCRRLERNLHLLLKKGKIDESILSYVNRLSDLLFELARVVNKRSHVKEVEWVGRQ